MFKKATLYVYKSLKYACGRICCTRGYLFLYTVLFSYRQDNSANTMTFLMVLYARIHYWSSAKKRKKIVMADFFFFDIFSKVVVVYAFAIFHPITNLVPVITFERIKLQQWDWAHLKDFFKSFQNVSKFM